MSPKLPNDDDIKEKDENMDEDETLSSSDSFSGSKVPVRLGDDSSLNLSKMFRTGFSIMLPM
jgi:topoisomerase-4 subunit A